MQVIIKDLESYVFSEIGGEKEILDKVDKLLGMYQNGDLEGEIMPEDVNPILQSLV